MATSAWRAAAALLRSTLEKTLLANGYQESNLYKKIEAAAVDGVITSARRQKAQDLVRTLGNDVLHEEWRKVEQEETELAYHYVGRVVDIHIFCPDEDAATGALYQLADILDSQQRLMLQNDKTEIMEAEDFIALAGC